MREIDSPCYQCHDRCVGCHAFCNKYKTFMVNRGKIYERRKKQLMEDSYFHNAVHRSICLRGDRP